MFRQMLYTQLKWSLIALAALVVAGFAIPVLSVQQAGAVASAGSNAGPLLVAVQSWGVAYPVLAGVVGLIAALTAWTHDHRGNHVYALSLPVARWRYALLRFVAGASLVIPVAVAVWIGGLAAGSASTIPSGLHAYPTALALRFVLTTLVAYAAFFAIASGTSRTAAWVLGVIGAAVVIQVVLSAAGVHAPFLPDAVGRLYTWPGPFQLFTGRWMLINV